MDIPNVEFPPEEFIYRFIENLITICDVESRASAVFIVMSGKNFEKKKMDLTVASLSNFKNIFLILFMILLFNFR